MNILFHARWSDHQEIIMHINSQNLALCRLKFFFLPKQKSSKEEMKQGGKKYLSAAKITIHILLRSREFFELHIAIPALAKSSAKENKIFLYVTISFITNFFLKS